MEYVVRNLATNNALADEGGRIKFFESFEAAEEAMLTAERETDAFHVIEEV